MTPTPAIELPALPRIVCQFSCGATSAVATKLALAQYGDRCVIVNAFVKNEDEDNRRFLRDCEAWFGQPIIVLKDEKYGADINEVFRRVGFMKGPRGAACTTRIKRGLLRTFEQPGDVLVIGYTAEEQGRYDDWLSAWPDRPIIAPLIDRGLMKSDCKAMVERAGIKLPAQYLRGYKNANCKVCIKGGMGYMRAARQDWPEGFEEVCKSEDLVASLRGDQARLLRHRSGPLIGQRFALRELPDGPIDREDGPPECGLMCESAEQEYAA
jgi:hypothetical protein